MELFPDADLQLIVGRDGDLKGSTRFAENAYTTNT
jgi:hypothetical protein